METVETFMGELFSVLKDSLRKQAFSVILLISACAGLWHIRVEDHQGLTSQIADLNARLDVCSKSREEMSIELGSLRASVSLLQRGIHK